MLLFGLVLLIGNVPSYGQCPTPGGTLSSQTFCYLQQVSDIARDGSNTAVFQTNDVVNDTQPIPSDEILSGGETYWVGDLSGACTDRRPVTATVNNAAYPVNSLFPGENSFTISPCSNANFTGNDLAGFFTAITGYEIKVYTGQFNNAEISTALTPNQSYFVGQVATALANSPQGSNCPSLRVAVGYNPTSAPAPTAASQLPFCQGATVGDLQAQGTSPNTQAIRWYRSATSISPLADNTLLINGQSYYATQIINNRNDPFPPCESDTRKKVDVILTAPIDLGGPYKGTVCIDEVGTTFPSIDEIRKFYIALIGNVVPDPASGTLSPNASQLANIYAADSDGLGDFTTTYTYGSGACASSVDITVSIIARKDAEAGTIVDIPVPCGSTDVVVLDDSLLSADATTGGTFSGTGVNSDGNFDPTTVVAGTYEITYTVDDNSNCVTPGTSDFTKFNITVGDGSGTSGDPKIGKVCKEDVGALFPSNDEVRKYLRALLGPDYASVTGIFNPTVKELIKIYGDDVDGLGDFPTTFTPDGGSCNSNVELIVRVIPTLDANAGTIEPITVPCDNSDIVVLDDSLLSSDATTGGTFSGTGVNSDGNFDPAVGPNTYVITYSVDDSADCVTTGTNDSTTFEITVGETGNSIGTPIEPEMCITEVIKLSADPTAAVKYFNDLVADLDPALDGDFTVEPSILGAQILAYISNPTTPSKTFPTNYTYVSSCGTVSTDISLTINNTTLADAGEIADFPLCQNEEDFDLFTMLTSANPGGGTFSDDSGVIEDGLFDISAIDVYTITYTVSEDDLETCLSGSNSTEFKLTVTENTIVIGNAKIGILCEAEVPTIFPSVDEIRKYLINLLDPGVSKTAGTFNPTPAQLAKIYQADADRFGDFKTNYTIVDGACSSSVELTVRIKESLDSPIAENTPIFCSADNVTLADIEVTGTNVIWFEDESLTTTADLTDSLVDGASYYAVSVSEDENICSSLPTSVLVSIITDASAPVAAATQDFCSTINPTVGDLLITGDNITVYEDADLTIVANIGDSLVDGDYYATALCSSESIMIIVTIGDPAEAPVAVAIQSFCLVDSNTVEDLAASGDNIVWYEDEDLTIVAPATTPLEHGDVYYAVATAENTCSSPSTMVTVTMNDSDAPTLPTGENEFCRSDNPTIQDLLDNLNGSGIQIYSSLTGGTAIATTTALQDGVQYFATATNATSSCESSERLAIRVEVAFCGIPEGFSPNGDNINDRFVIPEIAINYPNYNIEIYNRWGNMVFKGNASTPDWDGISNQSGTIGDGVLPVGVYFYILNYNDGATASEQGKLYLSI